MKPLVDHSVHMNRLLSALLLGVLVLGIAACGRKEPDTVTATAPIHHFEPESVERGARLFAERCAICHGPEGQGHPDWQRPSDGTFAAAPPLNGTGNDWKRTRQELAQVIKHGVRRKSDKAVIMPSMQGKLSERDIEDILNLIQSLWPSDVYESWNKAQLAATQPSR